MKTKQYRVEITFKVGANVLVYANSEEEAKRRLEHFIQDKEYFSIDEYGNDTMGISASSYEEKEFDQVEIENMHEFDTVKDINIEDFVELVNDDAEVDDYEEEGEEEDDTI